MLPTTSVTGRSIVEVDPPPAEWYAAGAAVAPWEDARPAGSEGALATEFALDLRPAEITDAVRAYAAPSFAAGRPLIEVLRDLNSRIFTDFTYRSGSTTVSVTVTGPSGESTARVCDSASRTSQASAGSTATTWSGVNSSSGCP